MFANQAQRHYYTIYSNISLFNQFCIKMQLFFECLKWQYLNTTKWQTLSFIDIISTNPILFTTKYLCKLCTKLNTIQQDVDIVYHGIVYLCKNVIQTYKDYLILSAGFNNLFLKILGFINNLYISIINYKAIYKPCSIHNYI